MTSLSRQCVVAGGHGYVCLEHKWINLPSIKQSSGILYKLLYQIRGQWVRNIHFPLLLAAVYLFIIRMYVCTNPQ